MVVLEIRFLAGQYHATPWGRNVNEGVIEWPPSPYRLSRALIDVCRRRRPNWDDARLAALLKPLQTPVTFYLPYALPAHTRSYLSSNEKNISKKQKIFDAFVVLDRNSRLFMTLDANISDMVRGDLNELLQELSYLGRAESWISARVQTILPTDGFVCIPKTHSSEHQNSDIVRVACLRPLEEFEAEYSQESCTWLEALSLSTGDLLKAGWNEPPAQKTIDYIMPSNALNVPVSVHERILGSRFHVASYSLSSSVLPRVTETVPFAERIRSKLMGIHKRINGGDPLKVSPLFSGKSKDGTPTKGHAHIFILPIDEDGDGRIDHVFIKSGIPFDNSELSTLDALNSVWQNAGKQDVHMVLNSLSIDMPGTTFRRFKSATPYVTKRHYRDGRGTYTEWLDEEIRRECKYHNLPEPVSIEWIDSTQGTAHRIRWMEFKRSRKGDHPLPGYGCVLEFDEPVKGPFAIGALAHYGLGLFVPG